VDVSILPGQDKVIVIAFPTKIKTQDFCWIKMENSGKKKEKKKNPIMKKYTKEGLFQIATKKTSTSNTHPSTVGLWQINIF